MIKSRMAFNIQNGALGQSRTAAFGSGGQRPIHWTTSATLCLTTVIIISLLQFNVKRRKIC